MWIVAKTEARAEGRVELGIRAMGVETYRATQRRTFGRRRGGSVRMVTVERPVLPGFVFARTTLFEDIRSVRGVRELLSLRDDGEPAIIGDSELGRFRAMIGQTQDGLRIGDRVEVTRSASPFHGLTGALAYLTDRFAGVRLALFGADRVVAVPADWIASAA